MIKRVNATDALMDFLNRNKVVNLNITGIIENEEDAEIYSDSEKEPHGVVVRNGYMNYIYTEDDNFLDEALETLFKEGFFGFSGLYRPLAEKIRKRYQVHWESRCALYYYPEKDIDLSNIKTPVSTIDIKDAETIDEFYTYRNEDSLEAIKKNIKNRDSSAIYVNDEIASWVLIHEDNSMGIMYTKEKYRKLGYAVDVTFDLIAKILKSGKIPFLQINDYNNMSPGLAAKCGFIQHGYADWFGIIAGAPKEIIEANDEIRKQYLKNIPTAKEYETSKLYGMFISTYSCDKECEVIEGFSVERVTDTKNLNTWCNVLADGLLIKNDKKEAFIAGVLKGVSNEENGYRVYIGRYNGNPVSTAAFLNLDKWSSGIFFTSAIPEMRSMELGKITLKEAMKKEMEQGVEVLVTACSKENLELLRSIGFTHTHFIE